MKTLNENQKIAIMHQNGPMLILAGPGSGKTFVITHRIHHLISNLNVNPTNILVITFTKSAAYEMRNRAIHLNSICSYVSFGTFHSVFYQILMKSNPHKKYQLVTDKERYDFVYHVLKHQPDINEYELSDQVEYCLKEISLYKNSKYDQNNEQSLNKLYRQVYKEYEKWLEENQKLDFDDMLLKCYELLLRNQSIRRYWQNYFSYILIDEFQDINDIQYQIIKLLGINQNIFAVGDDDQAIYSFRGAKPEIMKKFQEEYHAKIVYLNVNYRSIESIVDLANVIISKNKNRFVKDIVASRLIRREVTFIEALNREDEIRQIRNHICNNQSTNISQAILVRTNKMVSLYQNALSLGETSDKNIGMEMCLDFLSYLKFIHNGHKRKDFLRIMNKPSRYISRSLLVDEKVDFQKLLTQTIRKPWVTERIKLFIKQMNLLEPLDYEGQVKYIYHAMGYRSYFIEKGIVENPDMLYQNFMILLKKVNSLSELEEKIMDSQKIKENGNNIHIMTYHASKGLEFDVVYLPGCNLGKVPHGKMLSEEELEEERRMFYVAVTRAKENLVISYDKNQVVSPFISDIYSSSPYNSSNSTLSKYSSKASSTFSYSSSSSI